uniref:C-mannosyltransferase DPY19L1 n=3 Tax=Hirondellea gigas TaxID=1518452 RepID=A0A6A7FYY3_9CRUS
MMHTSSLFENDRRFSHLSDLEREMSFRTEMGFYYSHYKMMVEAPSFLSGLNRLLHNNITEYPNVVNSLQRFNVMPEVVIAGLYRGLITVSRWAELELQTCYRVTRESGLPPVWSCDGVAVPANFYLSCAWCMAGLTAAFIFLAGAQLSRTLAGGLLAAACFFFNHENATRVMWTPPLRETFAFPFSLLLNIIVTEVLRNPRRHYSQWLFVSVASYFYLVSWQFSQFTIIITIMVVYFFHTIELIKPLPMLLILFGCCLGFANCLVSMFANRMMMTSYLAGCLIAMFLMYVTLENIFNWLPPPFNKSIQAAFIVLSTMAAKMELSNWLGTEEDTHVYNILRSKFTNFTDFDTKLYTCADEYDFLPRKTILQLSQTFLIPLVSVVVGAVGSNTITKIKKHIFDSVKNGTELLPRMWQEVDPGIMYNIAMLIAYFVLSWLIMRLKLFMTPQLCIVAALVTSKKYFKFMNKKEVFYATMALILAVMTVKGARNIQDQRSHRGQYRNPGLEELLVWVETETTPQSVFAGTMPTMANLMLSTRRPIVNHPHYETAEVRRRTKIVYSVFSRRKPQVVYDGLLKLQVNYLVLDEKWCFRSSKPGCSMLDLWDVEEPQYKQREALCPKLYKHSPAPFHRVFANDEYVVLQIPSKYVQIPPPKSLQS